MEETIEVVPSEDNGNVPAEAPSEPTETATPAEPMEPVQPTEPTAPELFELPDGRKVDAETVAQEYKNLLSDYTRKSQTLAELEKGKLPTSNEPAQKPYTDPNWQPQTWAEAIELAKQEAIQEFEGKEKAKAEQYQAIENQVASQLAEIKTTDPTLNENALFLHANKYGFKDLKLAHQNMKDMAETVKKVQTTTAANIAKRVDPVSVTPGASGQKLDPSQFSSAVEYLRALKGTG